jgi:phospholipase/lecithinase/hemolysin
MPSRISHSLLGPLADIFSTGRQERDTDGWDSLESIALRPAKDITVSAIPETDAGTEQTSSAVSASPAVDWPAERSSRSEGEATSPSAVLLEAPEDTPEHLFWAGNVAAVWSVPSTGRDASTASLASAPLLFFGDSLSDPGNLAAQASLILPQFIVNALGDDGRATNGPVWAEVLVDELGVASSYNYAVAGGEASGELAIGDYVAGFGLTPFLTVDEGDPLLDWDMNLGGQIDRFMVDMQADNITGATAVLLIGLNDFGNLDLSAPLDDLIDQAETIGLNALNAIIGATSALYGVGAVSSVILMSLPSLSFFPAFFGESDEIKIAAEEVIGQFNDALDQFSMDAAGQLPGLEVSVLPLEALTEAVSDDATGFGFLAPQSDTLTGSSQDVLDAYDEDLFAFWDSLHPTAALQQVIAKYTEFLAENGGTLNALSENADAYFESQLTSDTITFGYGGNDAIGVGSGNDIAFGGSGDDTIMMMDGDDIASGGEGNDRIFGRQGNDVLAGGLGDDVLGGGQGNDVLIDGLGNDILRGWTGDDTFIWTDAALLGPDPDYGTQTFNGGDGFDTLYLVVRSEDFNAFQAALDGASPIEDLASIGLTVIDIEEILLINERDGLDTFGAETWFQEADPWGLT